MLDEKARQGRQIDQQAAGLGGRAQAVEVPVPPGQSRATALGEHLEHIETTLDGEQIEFTNLAGLGALGQFRQLHGNLRVEIDAGDGVDRQL